MKPILFAFIAICPFFTNAQILKGRVIDQETKEPLVGASLFIQGSSKGAASDSSGRFLLNVKAASKIIISHTGYITDTINLNLTKDSFAVFKLQKGIRLNEVVIEDTKVSIAKPNVISLDAKQLKTIPTIGGEADVLKALQILPGVSS
ncbi:MAG: carboxypeptidase-like regulatory domain-containing protein, partial [Bacteroidia bacterium]